MNEVAQRLEVIHHAISKSDDTPPDEEASPVVA
jgi:hypothetical protein